jgi:hypothetical protein
MRYLAIGLLAPAGLLVATDANSALITLIKKEKGTEYNFYGPYGANSPFTCQYWRAPKGTVLWRKSGCYGDRPDNLSPIRCDYALTRKDWVQNGCHWRRQEENPALIQAQATQYYGADGSYVGKAVPRDEGGS